ncbi:MAG TPA: LPS assembly protein LptD [Candidatus Polarisedimenticolia bacterium]|nr:LPS assembly protein LptD [Candidatus Polarisedimenticolia bacterium]
MRGPERSIALALTLLLALPGSLHAQQEGVPAGVPEAKASPEAPGAEGTRRVVGEGCGGKPLEIAAGPGSILGKDELILKEYVDIKCGDSRLQADFVRYTPSTKEAHAEGNVILDQRGGRITAESLDYNLETETGTFFGARGYADPSYYFEAARVEKISKDELVLHDATFTACTQPIPYWSFKIGRGLLRLDDYAYLHNLQFKIGRITVFYTPYLVWPVKSDRASGLLFPEFGFSRRAGTILSNALYWTMRRNMDATFFLDYMSLAGYGTGLEYRYVPSESGRGFFTGYYIRDQVAKQEQRPGVPIDRWVINYTHNQDFVSGWRLVSNANFISDFDYYRDFERDLRLSTNPQALSNLFLIRNWGFYSLNLRGERREQLVNVPLDPIVLNDPFFATDERTIVRWIEPEIELRGRRQRLGNSPFFLTLESSADYFRKGEEGADYQRFDLFPVFSSQLSPLPWLDVDANLGYRNTYYTKSQKGDLGCDNLPNTGDFGEGNGVVDAERDNAPFGTFGPEDDLGCDNLPGTGDFGEGNGIRDQEKTLPFDQGFDRDLYQGGLTLIGPKLTRVFDRPNSSFSPQYKNTIEPQIRYSYLSKVADTDRIIRFDEIDTLAGNANRVTYALVTRLFAKRPISGTEELGGGFAGSRASGAYVGGGQDVFAKMREALRKEREEKGQTPQGESPTGATAPEKKQLSTVEIATLEISQDYSFLGPLSVSGALKEERRYSPIRATLRVNPSIRASLDVRTEYDILFRQIREASLSANLRSPRRGFVDLTWSLSRDLEGQALLAQGQALSEPFNRSQIGLQGETNLLARRMLLGMQLNYDLGDIQPGEPRLRDQRYRLGYNTQCCGFQVEVLNRNFFGSSQREFRFLINLKGVGNVIDLQSGSAGGYSPGPFGGFQ